MWTNSSPVNNVTLSSSDFINENGDLVVKDKYGIVKEINSGEVSIRGENGYV